MTTAGHPRIGRQDCCPSGRHRLQARLVDRVIDGPGRCGRCSTPAVLPGRHLVALEVISDCNHVPGAVHHSGGRSLQGQPPDTFAIGPLRSPVVIDSSPIWQASTRQHHACSTWDAAPVWWPLS